MRNVIKCFFMFIVVFSFNIVVKADLHDYSGGGSGNTGTLSGGSWSTGYVGVKVSIVNSSNAVEDVEIFLNSSGEGGTSFSYDNNPKTHQSTSITWTAGTNRTTYTATFLPSNWKDSDGNTIDIYDILTKNSYENLKAVLAHSSLSGSAGTGDYIYVEPMVKIGTYYGTAFEMTNAFLNGGCGTSGTFCYSYSAHVFGGTNSGKRGVLYNTLYVSTGINGVTAFSDSGSTRDTRNSCLKTSSCGRGIGIFRYDDLYPTGNIQINKYKQGTSTLITSNAAEFKIYSGSNCTGDVVKTVTTSNGKVTVSSLKPGTYSIYESKVPGEDLGANKPYEIPKNRCVKTSVTVSTGQTTTTNIYNTPTCVTKLSDLGSNRTVAQLFDLFKEYPKFNNLLNISNPSCSASTCKTTIKDDKEKSIITGCLSASGETSSFNENNLSCYDEKIQNATGSYVGFCKDNLTLKNNLGVNKFYSYAGQFLIRNIEKDGNLIIKIYDNKLNPVEINNQYISTATTTKTCYVLSGNDSYVSSTLPNINVYFDDENNELKADVTTENSPLSTVSVFNKYVYKKIYNYKMKEVYLEKFTGKETTKSVNTRGPIYGIISKFNKTSGNIYFNVYYNGKWAAKEKDYFCTYELTPEVIRYEESSNGKIDVEFRIIDTTKPFERDTNSNWCDDSGDCSQNNDIVIEKIINSNNSYNKTGEGPIYKITLDPTDIKIIRKYNSDHKYEYYKLAKNSEGKYVNAFVYDLTNGILNKYKDNGTIKSSYGKLNHKLIIK